MSESWEDLALPNGFFLFDEDERGFGEEECEGSDEEGEDCLLVWGERVRRERARVLGRERRPCRGRRREEKEERLDCLLLLLFVIVCFPFGWLLLLLLVCLLLSRDERFSCLMLPPCFCLPSVCLFVGRVRELPVCSNVEEEGRREMVCCLEDLEEREERDRECWRGRRRGDENLGKQSFQKNSIS